MAVIKKGSYITMDPWVPEDESIPTVDYPYVGHADKNCGYNPFKQYGTKKMARFVEEILMMHKDDDAIPYNNDVRREE